MPEFPNLFLIGTQKGGSTSLHNALVQHPDIGRLRRKEPNIFSKPSETEARRELEDFPMPEGDFRYVIDGSVDYTRYPLYTETPQNILKICGSDVRFVYILRNPVDRLISQFFWKKGLYGQPLDFEDTIASDPQYVQTSCYDLQIAHFLKFYDISQFHFVRHSDFIRDPAARAAEVFRWLELDPDIAKTDLPRLGATDKQKTRTGRFGPLNRLLWASPGLRRTVRRMLPEKLARQAAQAISVEVDRQDPPRTVKRALLETHFLDSIDKTEKITGLDLSDWKTAFTEDMPREAAAVSEQQSTNTLSAHADRSTAK